MNRILVFLMTLLLTLTAAMSEAHSRPRSEFHPDEIERMISKDFYRLYSSQPGKAETPDPAALAEITEAVAETIGVLPPETFNDIVGHLLAEYRQNPRNRAAIEALLPAVRAQVARTLDEDRKSPVFTVIDDVFRVWTAAYAFRFGKGLWASRGSGLKGIERFRHVVKTVTERLPQSRRSTLALAGVGTGIGLAHALYEHLQTRKLDPMPLLRETQREAVHELAVLAADLKTEVWAASGTLGVSRARSILSESRRIQIQVLHFSEAAPQLTSQLEPIVEDLLEIQESLKYYFKE